MLKENPFLREWERNQNTTIPATEEPGSWFDVVLLYYTLDIGL
jgi:hypothetical protein